MQAPGMLFSSTLFAERAPPGHVALTAFVGGARQPRLALLKPDELQNLVHGEVLQLLGGRAAPLMARTHCWRYGLPQPGLEHADRLKALAALERRQPGLFFTGNYLHGVSAPACIHQASVTAERVRSYVAAAVGRQSKKHPDRDVFVLRPGWQALRASA